LTALAPFMLSSAAYYGRSTQGPRQSSAQALRIDSSPSGPTYTHAYHGLLGLLERTASRGKLSKESTSAERHISDQRSEPTVLTPYPWGQRYLTMPVKAGAPRWCFNTKISTSAQDCCNRQQILDPVLVLSGKPRRCSSAPGCWLAVAKGCRISDSTGLQVRA